MKLDQIHPELRQSFKYMPTLPVYNRLFVAFVNALMKIIPVPKAGPGVAIESRKLKSASVRIYRPEGALSGAALLWIHGGGLIIGRPEQDDRMCARLARDLKLLVVSVGYRLAPRYKYPCAIDDCFEAWQWLQGSAQELGVDAARIAVSGQSAGGGLAACLVQRIHDGGGTQPAAQLLFCPMLDDRTPARSELDGIRYPLWTNRSNRSAWGWYLGQAPGGPEVPVYASASRRENLTGLPPTWISVGDIDLFYDECRVYAERLKDVGVPCQLQVVPQAPHGFESIAPDAPLTRELLLSANRFLGESLRLAFDPGRIAHDSRMSSSTA